MVKYTSADSVLDLRDGVAKLFGNSLTLQGLDGIRVCGGRHDDECHNGDGRASFLETVVETWMKMRMLINSRKVNLRARDSMNMSTPLLRYS
jgi:hypothetical protein